MKLTAKQTEIRGMRRLAVVAACAVLGVATCAGVLGLSMHVNAQTASNDGDQAKTPKKILVSSEQMQGNVQTKVTPKYPDEAKKKHVQGIVVLHAVIGKDGAVKDVQPVSGPKILQQSAVDAVKQWTYKPYLLNGDPVEVETKINVTYSLAEKSKKNNAGGPPPPPPPPPSV